MDEREEMTVEVMYGSKTKQAYELIKQKILMLSMPRVSPCGSWSSASSFP